MARMTSPHHSHILRMATCGIIPVVVLPDAGSAVPLAHALMAGGIDVIEITLRNEAGLAGIEAVARAVPGMLVVAGTVLDASHLRQVADAGAQVVVSPGFTTELDLAAKEMGMPWLPGVATASDCMHAMSAGRSICKFFHAGQAGGPAMLRALGGPFPGLEFCPTGGVSLANLADYLAVPSVRMVGGSWIAPLESIVARDWDGTARRAKEARAAFAGSRPGA